MATPWRDDVALPRLSDFVLELGNVGEATARAGAALTELALDLPVEIDAWRVDDARVGDARVHIGLSTPTQIVATTVMPVLHRLVLRVVAVEEVPGDG